MKVSRIAAEWQKGFGKVFCLHGLLNRKRKRKEFLFGLIVNNRIWGDSEKSAIVGGERAKQAKLSECVIF